MASFADETAALMPSPFVLPDEFRALFDWCEGNGWIQQYEDDWPYLQKRCAQLAEAGTALGTDVEFRVIGPVGGVDAATSEQDAETPDTKDRILPFAQIGAEGSEAAYWIDEEGRQRIVMLGSVSGSHLGCVLTDRPVDFLRLIAIGYSELAWADEWTEPPVPDAYWPVENGPYRSWVETTFGVTIPATASEIVPRPVEYGETDTDDDFALWLNRLRDEH